MTIPFKTICARAKKRKGGPKALNKLLPPKPDLKALAKLRDDRVLAEMSRRVFCAGFAWSVIEAKWPGFEKAFFKFDPGRLSLQPDEFWDGLMKDASIVRNGAKIMSVRANATFLREWRREHGSFGKMLSKWPASDEIGLLALLAKRGSRTRRQYRPDVAALPRLGRVCDVERRGRMPARCRPRRRRNNYLQARPRKSAGAVQHLGRGDRPALHADVTDLRDVDRENYSTETLVRFVGGEE